MILTVVRAHRFMISYIVCIQPEHSNVCFWYLPKRLESIPPGPERDRELHTVSQDMKPFHFLINRAGRQISLGLLIYRAVPIIGL